MTICDDCQRRQATHTLGDHHVCDVCRDEIDRWMTNEQLRIARSNQEAQA